MKRLVWLLLLPIALAAVAQTSQPIQKLCSVSGRVVRADTGEPLKSARVGLIDETSQDKQYIAISTGDGSFDIKDVPPGRYQFWATHNGFVPQGFKAHRSGEEGSLLALAAGDRKTDILFRLIQAAAVVGRVTDEDGELVAGVEVEALTKPDPDESNDGDDEYTRVPAGQLVPAFIAVTNDLGEYRLYGLEPGDYFFSAIDSGDPDLTDWSLRNGGFVSTDSGNQPKSNHPPMYYPGVFQQSEAESLALRAGEETRVDFSLRATKMVAVAGRVMGANGKAAKDVSVVVAPRNMDLTLTDLQHTASTDANGGFRIAGISPGDYTVEAIQTLDGKQYSAEKRIEAGTDDLSVDLYLSPRFSVQGRVIAQGPCSGSKQDGIHVWLIPTDDSDQLGAADVRKDGRFTVPNLRAGEYRVRASDLVDGCYLRAAQFGTEDVLEHGFRVTSAMGSGTLELTLSAHAAQVDGSVVRNGTPVGGATVRLKPEVEHPNRKMSMNSTTDQYGKFIFKNIPPGDYVVSATVDDETAGNLVSNVVKLRLDESQKKSVTLEIPKAGQ